MISNYKLISNNDNFKLSLEEKFFNRVNLIYSYKLVESLKTPFKKYLIALVVPATTKVIVKNTLSNEKQFFATTFVVVINGFSCS